MASEYGWAKRDILEQTYIDELILLVRAIKIRKISDYQMQLAIAQNPHVKNPKELWQILEQGTRKPIDEKPDKKGLENLKRRMAGESHGFAIK